MIGGKRRNQEATQKGPSESADVAKFFEETPRGRVYGLAPEVPNEESLQDRVNELWFYDHVLDYQLKKFLGPLIGGLVAGQVLLMNLGFLLYIAIRFTQKQPPDSTVVIAYLTTSTAEVVGLALVVTRYLFPERGTSWDVGSE